MEFHNPGFFLKPGMFATVRIAAELQPSALLAPGMAVLRSGENNTVFVALPGGKFEPRTVALGLRAEEDYWTRWSLLWRKRKAVTGMVGSKCKKCGTAQFPPQLQPQLTFRWAVVTTSEPPAIAYAASAIKAKSVRMFNRVSRHTSGCHRSSGNGEPRIPNLDLQSVASIWVAISKNSLEPNEALKPIDFDRGSVTATICAPPSWGVIFK
jgi:hypothetical protein